MSESVDIDGERSGTEIGVGVPDIFENAAAFDDLVCIAAEEQEDGVFFCGEMK